MTQEARALYRLFRQSRYGLALSVALNLAMLSVGFLVVLLGETADGIWQMGVALFIFFGFVVGITLAAVANIVIELTGPGE